MRRIRRWQAGLLSLLMVASGCSLLAGASSENLARGCPVTATKQLGDYDVNRLTDGATPSTRPVDQTGITSFDSTGYGYFEITFDKATILNRVELYFNQAEPTQRPRDIAVDVRHADGVYERVAELHGISYTDAGTAVQRLTFRFADSEAVAFRVTGNRQRTCDINNAPTANYNFRLMEIEAYRDTATDPAGYTGTESDENAAYNIPVPEPLLINRLAGAAVTANEQLSNFDIQRLTDGKNNLLDECAITRYNTAGFSYMQATLAEVTALNHVRVYFSTYEPANRPKDLAVDVLQENGVWVRAAELHAIDYDVKGANSAGVRQLDFKFPTVDGTAVRLTANRASNTNSNNFRLVELEGYLNTGIVPEDYTGTESDENAAYNIPVPEPLLINRLAGAAVTANEQLSNFDIQRLTDGKNNLLDECAITRYNTAGFSYMQATLAEVTALNHVRVYFSTYEPANRPKDLAVDVLQENGVWVRAAELHAIDYDVKGANSAGVRQLDFKFPTVDGTAVRLTANRASNTNSNNFRLVELEGYLNTGIVPEDYTGTVKSETERYNIPVPDPLLLNVALGCPVTSNEQLGEYDVNRLTDGNEDFNAQTDTNAIARFDAATDTSYFEIELKQIEKISRVSVFLTKWETAYLPLDMAVDVRLANGVYVRAAEQHNLAYAGVEKLNFDFAPLEAVAIRVTGSRARNARSDNFRLMEIAAYYHPGLTEADYTGTAADADPRYNIPVPEPILTNVAAGKPVTANETLTAGEHTYDAAFLTDGNSEYFAGTDTNAITNYSTSDNTGWFEIDLGSEIAINQVAVFLTKWQPEFLPLDMAVDIRLANGVYVRAAELHNIDYTNCKKLTFRFAEQEAVAIRVTGNRTRNARSDNFRLMEIEVYFNPALTEADYTGTAADADPRYNIAVPETILENLAKGKPVTANETLSANGVTYDAALLTDGDSEYFAGTNRNAITKWNTVSNTGWFEVDLETETAVNQMSLFLTKWQREFLPLDIAVDVRLANGVYIRAAERHNIAYGDLRKLSFRFAEQKAVAIRVTGSRARNEVSDNFRLMEIEVYHNPMMAETDYTGTTPDSDARFNIEVPDPKLTNLAAGMPVTANETLSANGVIYEAARLTDGFKEYHCDSATAYTAITKWITATKCGWYEVTFPQATRINQVKVYLSRWQTEFLPQDMAVDVKLKNGQYVRVAERHAIEYKGVHDLTFNFPEQEAVAFRVAGNANRNESSANFRLLELEAYYWPGMPAEKYTGTEKDRNTLYNITEDKLREPAKETKPGTDKKDDGKKPAKPASSGSTGTIQPPTTPASGGDTQAGSGVRTLLTVLLIAAGAVTAVFLAGDAWLLAKLGKSTRTHRVSIGKEN